jgi:hypothetical protein
MTRLGNIFIEPVQQHRAPKQEFDRDICELFRVHRDRLEAITENAARGKR